MTQPFQQWKVPPHGKLSQIDDNILTVIGEIHMPLMDLPRRMTVVRLTDSRLVVWSAIALDEDEMVALEACGVPAYLIVPSDKHRLDAKIWKDRYPGIPVVAPEGALAKVEEIVPVDTGGAELRRPACAVRDCARHAGSRGGARRSDAKRHDARIERRGRQHPERIRLRRLAVAHSGLCRQGSANPQGREDGDDRRHERAARSVAAMGRDRIA